MVRISFVAPMLLAVTVVAQPAPPSKRLADLHGFQGAWTCTGKAPRRSAPFAATERTR